MARSTLVVSLYRVIENKIIRGKTYAILKFLNGFTRVILKAIGFLYDSTKPSLKHKVPRIVKVKPKCLEQARRQLMQHP